MLFIYTKRLFLTIKSLLINNVSTNFSTFQEHSQTDRRQMTPWRHSGIFIVQFEKHQRVIVVLNVMLL